MIIGVTGGVGCGKSTILSILKENYGAHLLMCDDIAKELMEPGKVSYKRLVKAFGTDILVDGVKNNPIDRTKLAEIIFSDEEKHELVNSLTHPDVKRELIKRSKKILSKDKDAIIVVEAALLIEAGYTDIINELWVVLVDREVRIERLAETRGYTREKSITIMENQLSDEEFAAHADFIINNSGDLEDTEKQIREHLEAINERDRN